MLTPGRGTLMNDMLNTFSQYKDINDAISSVCLVETSTSLQKVQRETLEKHGKVISHYDFIEDVPRMPSIIIAHEFFDALPVHMFTFTERGWREVLVDVDTSESAFVSLLMNRKFQFRYVLAPDETHASTALTGQPHFDQHKILGRRIEVCPAGWDIARNIGERVGNDGGMALVVDYGENSVCSDTLRGVLDHKVGILVT